MSRVASVLCFLAAAASHASANPTHYGDPKGGCMADEQAVHVQGLSGDFCSPPCTSAGVCPKDVPSGDTAKPQCALRGTAGSMYCALICTPSALASNGTNGECGTGACQNIQGVGICTYAVAGGTLVDTALAAQSSELLV